MGKFVNKNMLSPYSVIQLNSFGKVLLQDSKDNIKDYLETKNIEHI